MYRHFTLSKTVPWLQKPFCLKRLAPLASNTSTRLFTASAHNNNNLTNGSNSYLEAMYDAWLKDKHSVDGSWQSYFERMGQHGSNSEAPLDSLVYFPSNSARLPVLPGEQVAGQDEMSKKVADHMKIQLLSRAYQVRGHHIAKLDPLGIQFADREHTSPPELQHTYYGFKDSDLDRTFTIGPGILPSYLHEATTMTLRQIIDHLQRIYCKPVSK